MCLRLGHYNARISPTESDQEAIPPASGFARKVEQYESTFYKSANLEWVLQVAQVLSQARAA